MFDPAGRGLQSADGVGVSSVDSVSQVLYGESEFFDGRDEGQFDMVVHMEVELLLALDVPLAT